MHAKRTCGRGHAFLGNDPCPVCWPGYRSFKMRVKVWLYPGEMPWHFVTLPKKLSTQIKDRFASLKRGWGSLPVTVTTGKTGWETSIFPDKKAGAYLLPIKADARRKENIGAGDSIVLTLEVRA